jgi:hypothetical protein
MWPCCTDNCVSPLVDNRNDHQTFQMNSVCLRLLLLISTIGIVHCSFAGELRALSTIVNATGASACFTQVVTARCVAFQASGSCGQFKGSMPTMVATCDNAGSTVVSFAMRNLNVSGTLPTEIGFLSSLTTLAVAFCNVSGTVPSQLGLLSHLQELRLFDNSLSGSLPTQLVGLTALSALYIDQNFFSGTLSDLPNGLLTSDNCVVQSDRASEHSCFNCGSLRVPCSCSSRSCDISQTETETKATISQMTAEPERTVETAVFSGSTTTLPTSTSTSTSTAIASISTTTSPAKQRIAPVVGGAIGGAVVALLVGAILFVICRARSNKGKEKEETRESTNSTSIYGVLPESTHQQQGYDHGIIDSFVKE